jgi:Stress up-regulated Nod 19
MPNRAERRSVTIVLRARPVPAFLALITVSLLAGACAGDGAARPAAADGGAAATTVVRYGPFAVPPMSGPMADMHGHGDGSGVLSKVILDVPKPCEDCWLTGFRPSLATPSGEAVDMASGVMLHHFVLADAVPSCGDVAGPDPRFFAAGSELTGGSLPEGYGYRVDEGDRWGAVVELMNSGADERLVYVDVAFRHTSVPQRSVVPLWLDAGGCGGSAYTAKAGTSVRTRSYRLGVGGAVVAAVGHLHPGGVRVTVADDTTGQTVCRSVATGSALRVRAMSACEGDPVATVHRGDRLRVTSVYHAAHRIRGAMGIVLAYLAPGAGD